MGIQKFRSAVWVLTLLLVGLLAFSYSVKTKAAATASAPALANAAPTTRDQPRVHYVATDGSDSRGNGSVEQPWATITHAVAQVADGATILVRPGWYEEQVVLSGTFAQGITIRSEVPYRAQLRYQGQVISCFMAQGIMLEGFDIAHIGDGAGIYVVQIQDQLGDQHGGDRFVSRIVLRNNILHDSYNNDIVKVNNGAGQILIEGNMFYNQQGLDSHLDINSVTNVIVQDNIFFNDFAGSGRTNHNDTGSYVVIKDSNGDDDTNLGASNITVRRNVFLNWEGDEDNTFVVIGEDSVDYYQAHDVLLENNLFLGNAENRIRAAFQARGVRDITFRHNTVVGDLPSKAYAMRLSQGYSNPRNRNIYFYNNIWSDPTGTMGSQDQSAEIESGFADAPALATSSYELHGNLYWNGDRTLPQNRRGVVNVTDDRHSLVRNPALPTQEGLLVPRWDSESDTFADGSTSIREAFVRLVRDYGTPGAESAAIHAADPAQAPWEDILGMPRQRQQPTIGAVEQVLLGDE